MGFETFQIELAGGKVSFPEANDAVRKFPRAQPDPEAIRVKAWSYYVIDDGQHIIEVEVMDAPVKLSCQFTLCHPSSVDSAFLAFVREVMDRLGMTARICDNVTAEHARSFSLADFAEFSTITSGYIAARRAEWIAAFGDDPLAATTSEVYQRVILPRCQPGIEQPT